MKKLILILVACFVSTVNAAGLDGLGCSEVKTYKACKPGYYLLGGMCMKCPDVDGVADTLGNTVSGNSADKNTSGISACYFAKGIYTDESGVFRITATNGECTY